MSNAVQKQLADWIDADVIAEQVLETLRDEKISLTLANAQKVWLDVLYTELGKGIIASVRALIEKGDLDEQSGDEQLPESICDDRSIAK